MGETMITAHSGADGTKENSLEFVAYAMQTGADALEVDVRMGENGILILSHDKTDEDAVRLADVFRMMGKYPGMRINCDLKECGLEVAVRQLALISGLKTEQILYSGSVRPVPVTESCIWRDVEVFWNIEEYLPDIYKEQKEDLLFEQAAYKISRACRKYGIHTVNVNEKIATEEFIRVTGENDIDLFYQNLLCICGKDVVHECVSAFFVGTEGRDCQRLERTGQRRIDLCDLNGVF